MYAATGWNSRVTPPIPSWSGGFRLRYRRFAEVGEASTRTANETRVHSQNHFTAAVSRRHGMKSLPPAKSWNSDYNKGEPIEMYAAWPYRLVG